MKKDTTRFELVPIEKIIVGVRRRIDNGDIPALASKIEEHGLIHPILLDGDYNLVCGGRRLLAFQHLKRKSIPATIRPPMSPTARRLLERVENLARKDFTDIEDARDLLELAKETAEELRRESLFDESEGLNRHGAEKVPHRPKKPDSQAAVAKRISETTELSVSPRTLGRAEQRVAAVEENPELASTSQRKTLGEDKPKKSLSVAAEAELSEIMRACGRDEMGTIEKVVKDYHKYLFGMSEECFNRIVALRDEHGYKSEQSVIDSAVETLYTLVTNNKPPASVKRPERPASSLCDYCHEPTPPRDRFRDPKSQKVGHRECIRKGRQ